MTKNDVKKIVKYCNEEKIPIYVYGGGSSATKGLTTAKGGVNLVIKTHMNKVLKLNKEIYKDLYQRVYLKIYKKFLPLFKEIQNITGYPE